MSNTVQLQPVSDLTSIQRNFDLVRKALNDNTTNIDLRSGKGSPENVVKANMGAIYTDVNTGEVYKKTKSNGKTGWIQLIDSSSLTATAPALTDKYVLPATVTLTNGVLTQTGLKITIPQDGLYHIDCEYDIYASGGNSLATTHSLRLNGVVITGTENYILSEIPSGNNYFMAPTCHSFSGTYKAGDVIELYAKSLAGTGCIVRVQAGENSAFIQYTQLSKNVPVVTTVAKEYAFIRISTNTTTGVAAGSTLKFDTQEQGNMTFDGANYKVLLKANVKYRMQCSTMMDNSTSYTSLIQFYNLNNSTYINGAAWRSYGSANYNGGDAGCIVCFPVDTYVCVKLSADSSNNNAIWGGRYSWWLIESIEATIPVVATLGQDAWEGQLQDLIVTSRDYTPTLKYEKVKFTKDSNGQWFAEFFITTKYSNAIRTGQNWYCSGFTFKSNGGSGYHYLYGGTTGIASNYSIAYPEDVSAGGRLTINHASGYSSDYNLQGKVPLNGKPVGYNIPGGV